MGCNPLSVLLLDIYLFFILFLYRVSPGITGYHRVSPGITGYHRLSPGITGYHRVSPGITGYHQVSPGITGYHRVSLDPVIFDLAGLRRSYNAAGGAGHA